MNSKYLIDNNDNECEECSSKAEFKEVQQRTDITNHHKGSKNCHSTLLFRKHPLPLTHPQQSLLYSVEQVVLCAKDPEKCISIILFETKTFKMDILICEQDLLCLHGIIMEIIVVLSKF